MILWPWCTCECVCVCVGHIVQKLCRAHMLHESTSIACRSLRVSPWTMPLETTLPAWNTAVVGRVSTLHAGDMLIISGRCARSHPSRKAFFVCFLDVQVCFFISLVISSFEQARSYRTPGMESAFRWARFMILTRRLSRRSLSFWRNSTGCVCEQIEYGHMHDVAHGL
jgi:hypothetical protein